MLLQLQRAELVAAMSQMMPHLGDSWGTDPATAAAVANLLEDAREAVKQDQLGDDEEALLEDEHQLLEDGECPAGSIWCCLPLLSSVCIPLPALLHQLCTEHAQCVCVCPQQRLLHASLLVGPLTILACAPSTFMLELLWSPGF